MASFCFSGAGETHKELDTRYTYILTHTGAMSAISDDFEVKTFCPTNLTDSSWPMTTIHCSIEVMVNHFSLAGYDSSMKIDIVEESNWKITDAMELDEYISSQINFILEDDATYDDDTYPNNPRMFVGYFLVLQQNQDYFRFMFQANLLACLLLMGAATFSCNYPRYCLVMLSLLIGCLSMMALADTAPSFYISKIGKSSLHLLKVTITAFICLRFFPH